MDLRTARNVGIVLLIAVAVYAVPGGGVAAGIVGSLISVAFAVGIWLLLHHLYREHRMTIFGLGDRHRGLLYGSLAALLFAGAAAGEWFQSAPLTLAWLVLLGGAVYGLVVVFRYWRAYS